MTLEAMSEEYRRTGDLLRIRLRTLRRQRSLAQGEERWRLNRRIQVLTPMLTQANELADLTKHYYERGYYRSEKYCL